MAGLSEADPRPRRRSTPGSCAGCAARHGAAAARVSPFAINASSGFSSESLLFDLAVTSGGVEQVEPMVLRLAPAGGGLFPEYDLAPTGRAQNLLADLGVPAGRAGVHEPDETWLGTDFLVMPRIAGRLPADFTYILKGWLKDAGDEPTSELLRVVRRPAGRPPPDRHLASRPRLPRPPVAAAWPPRSSGGPTTSTGRATAAPTR